VRGTEREKFRSLSPSLSLWDDRERNSRRRQRSCKLLLASVICLLASGMPPALVVI